MKSILLKSIECLFCVLKLLRIKFVNNLITNALDKIYTIWVVQELGSDITNVSIKRYSNFIGERNIYLGANTIIEKHCCIETIEEYVGCKYQPKIILGNNVHLGEYNHLTAINSITIKDGVLTGRRVTISDNNHGLFNIDDLMENPSKRILSSKGEVVIGRNVWIGENVCILSGVKIGDGCVIAANAVVTKSIPDYCLVAGVPAKIIKQI